MSQRDPMLLSLPLLLAAALLVTACVPDTARWSPTEARKENRVDFIAMPHDVRFQPGSATLAANEDKRLADFLHAVELGYGDQVTFDAGPPHGDSTTDALTSKRIDVIAATLRRLHINAAHAARPTVDGALAHDAVVVTVGRYVVTGPECPDWRKPEADDYTNTPPSNFGCANATNLGMMVANPAELVRGTPGGPADADFAARGVQRYRSGEIAKSLKPELPKLSGGSGGAGGGGN